MSFSPIQAALEGFRFIRERPQAVTLWMAAFLALKIATAAFAASPWAAPLGELQLLFRDGAALADYLALAPRLAPAAALSVFLSLASVCVIFPSILRSMLRDERASLRLGMDEARMFGLFLAVVGMTFLAGIFLAILFGLLAGQGARFGVGGLFRALLALVTPWLPLYFMVRMSLTAPLAIETHHLDLAAGWRLSRGHMVRLALATVVCIIMMLAVWAGAAVVLLAMVGAILLIAGGDWESFWDWLSPSGDGFFGFFGPGPLLRDIVDSALTAVAFCIFAGAAVYAYRALKGRADESV